MPMREQADKKEHNEQSFMINLPPSPGIKTLEKICEIGLWRIKGIARESKS